MSNTEYHVSPGTTVEQFKERFSADKFAQSKGKPGAPLIPVPTSLISVLREEEVLDAEIVIDERICASNEVILLPPVEAEVAGEKGCGEVVEQGWRKNHDHLW